MADQHLVAGDSENRKDHGITNRRGTVFSEWINPTDDWRSTGDWFVYLKRIQTTLNHDRDQICQRFPFISLLRTKCRYTSGMSNDPTRTNHPLRKAMVEAIAIEHDCRRACAEDEDPYEVLHAYLARATNAADYAVMVWKKAVDEYRNGLFTSHPLFQTA